MMPDYWQSLSFMTLNYLWYKIQSLWKFLISDHASIYLQCQIILFVIPDYFLYQVIYEDRLFMINNYLMLFVILDFIPT